MHKRIINFFNLHLLGNPPITNYLILVFRRIIIAKKQKVILITKAVVALHNYLIKKCNTNNYLTLVVIGCKYSLKCALSFSFVALFLPLH